MRRSICIACAMLMVAGIVASTFAADGPEATASIMPSKAAATQPSNTNVTGTITFTQTDADIHVVGDITGLSPGKHGIHIHAKADMSDPQLKMPAHTGTWASTITAGRIRWSITPATWATSPQMTAASRTSMR